MAVPVQHRRDTAANWASNNPVPLSGQMCIETDTLRYKLGDGVTAWNSLAYGVFDGASSGFNLTYSTTTTDADPGGGYLRFDNTTFGSITKAYIDNADKNGADITPWIDSFDDPTSSPRGYLKVVKRSDQAAWMLFHVTGAVVDGTGYRKVNLTPITNSGTISNDDEIVVIFTPAGTAGFAPGKRLLFDGASHADSDPTAGYFRTNNATFGSITELYIDNLDDAGADITTWLDSLDNSTTASEKGYLLFTKAGDADVYMEFVVTNTVTDGTGYRKVPVSPYGSAGTLSNGDQVVVTFSRTGNAGSVGAQSDGESIDDNNANELLEFGVTASAVNHLKVKNAATGNGPELQAAGDDTNIDVVIRPKGTGLFKVVGDTVLTAGVQSLDSGEKLQVLANFDGIRLLAAGDIIVSLDASAPANCVELDGATITGGASTYALVAARYSWMVSGANLILPDFRGRFIRVWAHGSSNDPDRASRTARAGDGQTGDYPGTYQADGAPDITGQFQNRAGRANVVSGTGAFSTTGSDSLAQVSGANSGPNTAEFAASNSNAKYGAGTDIRPINVAVSVWMVVG